MFEYVLVSFHHPLRKRRVAETVVCSERGSFPRSFYSLRLGQNQREGPHLNPPTLDHSGISSLTQLLQCPEAPSSTQRDLTVSSLEGYRYPQFLSLPPSALPSQSAALCPTLFESRAASRRDQAPRGSSARAEASMRPHLGLSLLSAVAAGLSILLVNAVTTTQRQGTAAEGEVSQLTDGGKQAEKVLPF